MKKEILVELLKRKKAEESFKEFVLYLYPNYILNPMFDSIANLIDDIILNTKKNKDYIIESPIRALLTAPPRSGKTLLTSQLFPAFYFGKFPNAKIIASSFGDELLKENARSLKRLMRSEKYKVLFGDPFPKEVEWRNSQDTILHFEVFEGRYDAYTVGGSIIGKGANLLIVDDPIKNSEMARSKKQKDNLEDWFYNDACSRLEGAYSIFLMHQRWAVDDLAGRVIEKESECWTQRTFKAIDNTGKSICEKLLPIEELEHKQKTMPSFEAMYQQNPIISGGNIIKSTWFKRYDFLPLKFRKKYLVCDTAMKAGTAHDFTVISTWGLTMDGDYYLIDLYRDKLESPELVQTIKDIYFYHSPKAVYIEDKASGTSIIQMLRKDRIPVIELKAIKDKYLRVQDVLPKIVSGYCFIPAKASWVHEFVTECEAFTSDGQHPFDDQVDCLSYALSDQCSDKKASLNIRSTDGLLFT